jgi:hypothetical protein
MTEQSPFLREGVFLDDTKRQDTKRQTDGRDGHNQGVTKMKLERGGHKGRKLVGRLTRNITTRTRLGTDTERGYKKRKKIIKNFKAEELMSPGSKG